jgi:hypothetical protein
MIGGVFFEQDFYLHHRTAVGAGLPAMAVGQSTSMFDGLTLSRASRIVAPPPHRGIRQSKKMPLTVRSGAFFMAGKT